MCVCVSVIPLFSSHPCQDNVEGEGDSSLFVASPSSSSAAASASSPIVASVRLSTATASKASAATSGSGQSDEVRKENHQEVDPPLFWNHQFRARDQRALVSVSGWLTDECINILGGLFWRQAAQRTILEGHGALSKIWLSSLYFSQLCAGDRDQYSQKSQPFFNTAVHEQLSFHQRVKDGVKAVHSPSRAAAACHHLFEEFAEVLIPIHHQGNHWLLAVYRASENMLTIYDSLRNPNDSSYLPIAESVGAFLAWQRENNSSSSSCGCRHNVDSAGLLSNLRSASPTSALRLRVDRTFPQQDNGTDCGVYLLIAAQLLLNARLQSSTAGSAAAAAAAAAPAGTTISSIDLNPDVARGARRLWTAYLTQPQLHLSPLLHAEIYTDTSTPSAASTSPTTPMDHPGDVMLDGEASSQSSSAASTETCTPLPFSSLRIRPLIHACESVPLATDGDASMTDASAQSEGLDASRSTLTPFAVLAEADCLWTANAAAASLATTRSISDSSSGKGSEAAAAGGRETPEAAGLVGSPSRTTRAHSALLLDVLRGKHKIVFMLWRGHGFATLCEMINAQCLFDFLFGCTV